MPRPLYALAVLAALMPSTPSAQAASQALQNECNSDNRDVAISACTKILGGREPKEWKAWAYRNRGWAYKEKGNYDQAISDYMRAIELAPKDASAYRNLGYLHNEKGNYDQAIADITRAIELDPKNASAYNNRGYAYNLKGNYDQAIVDLTRSIELDPDSALAFANRATAYNAKGNYNQALADATRAIELNPTMPAANYQHLLALQRIEAAKAAAKASAPQQQATVEAAKPSDLPSAVWYGRRPAWATTSTPTQRVAVEPARPSGPLPLDPRDVPKYNSSPTERPAWLQPFPTPTQQAAIEPAKPIEGAPVQGAPSAAAFLQGKRVALVIGNDEYESLPDLKKAVNDAHAVGTALTKLGFEVLTLENTSRREMNTKLVEFTSKIGPGDTGFFFFAGHGVQLRGTNYLLPIDTPEAEEGQEGLISGEGIAADTVLQEIQSRGAKVAMLVLDACRDNPFAKPGQRGVGGTRGLTLMTVPEGVFVLYSAGVGETALDRLTEDDPDPNSVFTRTFVSLLDQPGLTLHDIAKRTQRNVYELAKSVSHTQMPAYYDQILGELTLLPSN